MLSPPERIVSSLKEQTFKQRASEIADRAHNSRSALGEGAEFTKGLDENERQCKAYRNLYSLMSLMDMQCFGQLMMGRTR